MSRKPDTLDGSYWDSIASDAKRSRKQLQPYQQTAVKPTKKRTPSKRLANLTEGTNRREPGPNKKGAVIGELSSIPEVLDKNQTVVKTNEMVSVGTRAIEVQSANDGEDGSNRGAGNEKPVTTVTTPVPVPKNTGNGGRKRGSGSKNPVSKLAHANARKPLSKQPKTRKVQCKRGSGMKKSAVTTPAPVPHFGWVDYNALTSCDESESDEPTTDLVNNRVNKLNALVPENEEVVVSSDSEESVPETVNPYFSGPSYANRSECVSEIDEDFDAAMKASRIPAKPHPWMPRALKEEPWVSALDDDDYAVIKSEFIPEKVQDSVSRPAKGLEWTPALGCDSHLSISSSGITQQALLPSSQTNEPNTITPYARPLTQVSMNTCHFQAEAYSSAFSENLEWMTALDTDTSLIRATEAVMEAHSRVSVNSNFAFVGSQQLNAIPAGFIRVGHQWVPDFTKLSPVQSPHTQGPSNTTRGLPSQFWIPSSPGFGQQEFVSFPPTNEFMHPNGPHGQVPAITENVRPREQALVQRFFDLGVGAVATNDTNVKYSESIQARACSFQSAFGPYHPMNAVQACSTLEQARDVWHRQGEAIGQARKYVMATYCENEHLKAKLDLLKREVAKEDFEIKKASQVSESIDKKCQKMENADSTPNVVDSLADYSSIDMMDSLADDSTFGMMDSLADDSTFGMMDSFAD